MAASNAAYIPRQAGLDRLCLAGLCVYLLQNMAHQQGFEPRPTVLETAILPLDDWYASRMVGCQGVEPRLPLRRLIYSQVQSPMLLTTRIGAQ